jgi:membrane protein YqaA with SNARE-associated domain
MPVPDDGHFDPSLCSRAAAAFQIHQWNSCTMALDDGIWLYPVIWLELFLESSGFPGAVLPGDNVAILMGAVLANNVTSFWLSLLLINWMCLAGHVSGYLLDRYYGEAILKKSRWAGRHYDRRHQQMVRYARRWGIWISMIGRFVLLLRALTALTMGRAKTRYFSRGSHAREWQKPGILLVCHSRARGCRARRIPASFPVNRKSTASGVRKSSGNWTAQWRRDLAAVVSEKFLSSYPRRPAR